MPKAKSRFYVPDPEKLQKESVNGNRTSNVLNSDDPTVRSSQLEPKLLERELVIGKVEKALRYNTYSGNSTGVAGDLICTNFKITFVTAIQSTEEAMDSMRLIQTELENKKLLNQTDIPLTNVSEVHAVSGDKSKRLTLSKLSVVPSQIQIHTKDFYIHVFDFSQVKQESQVKMLVTAILHHAFPQRHDLLYAYEFAQIADRYIGDSENGSSEGFDVRSLVPPSFDNRSHWDAELGRLHGLAQWRITLNNSDFKLSPSMPKFFPIPKSASDAQLSEVTSSFNGKRLPLWCYSHINGSSIVAMANLVENSPDTYEQRLVQWILASDKPDAPTTSHHINVSQYVCNVPDLQTAYNKLSAVCAPGSAPEFYNSDNAVYTQIDASCWLSYVTSCLRVSCDIVEELMGKPTVVFLREDMSCDLTCVLSSLMQILLDPTTRSISGFQALVQRCWVAAGHPFCSRLGLLNDDEQSPVFLLFLDSVYQLTRQFPSAFEFSEFYLISLWDSLHLGLFREFIFDNEADRQAEAANDSKEINSRSPKHATFPSVWNWDLQYGADYLALFCNPLYKFLGIKPHDRVQQSPSEILMPNTHPSQMEIWHSCYYRDVAPVQVTNGGKPAEFLQQCIIMEEITELQNQIGKFKSGSLSRKSGLYFNSSQQMHSHKSMRAKLKSSYITSTFPFNNRISRVVSDISLCTLLEHSRILVSSPEDDDP